MAFAQFIYEGSFHWKTSQKIHFKKFPTFRREGIQSNCDSGLSALIYERTSTSRQTAPLPNFRSLPYPKYSSSSSSTTTYTCLRRILLLKTFSISLAVSERCFDFDFAIDTLPRRGKQHSLRQNLPWFCEESLNISQRKAFRKRI
jgi:hypothetical protein